MPLGGQQIAMRVWYLLALLLDALAVPAQVFVSSRLGAGDKPGAHQVGGARSGSACWPGSRWAW